ncbi:MAG: type III-A CRISPR-associated protein Csm2 [Bacteroidetes bacterium]|jgi:CRISPR-associated protein Csm2|nr:type III-A CRISPR-associated protein Csm2 [Bacteroidota bacterium]MBT6686028.1 type III-A CRISPR-associated protein Csm2 [Bacteroidota bacterium]MBT7144537.1 type III-A CRISPR-associated protein Csm2 [Bacteroidota bacterium]MBT7492700.1 type III-A CRISPR-associated protein Csm2 [Bacteroidota bacterium]
MNNNKKKQSDSNKWKERFKPEVWIIGEGFNKDADKFSDDLGKYLKNSGLTSSQIRIIFGELKRIEMKGFAEGKTAFLLLKSKFMKATAKDSTLMPLKDIFYSSYELINTEDIEKGKIYFLNFMNLFEAIVNYFTGYNQGK